MTSPLPATDDALVAFTHAYGEHHIRRSEASRFAAAYGSLSSWRALSLDERLASPPWAKPMICWAVLTRRLDVDVDYVVACRSRWGNMARRLFPDEHARFLAATDELGFCAQETRQWSMLMKAIAAEPSTGSPLTIDDRTFQSAADKMLEAVKCHRRSLPKSFSTPMFGLQATLFHLGTLQQPPRKRAGKPASRTRAGHRSRPPSPLLAATRRRYLEQIDLSLRPGTVAQADTSLRAFAGWLTDHAPDVDMVTAIRREHIEAYKTWLHRQDGYQGRKFSAATITHRLGDLRTFLDRIIEWGWPAAPDRPLIFLGDFPRPDRPLPRFLDDGAAAKLLAAARSHPDPFARLAVEMLARTGLRTGELLDLTIGAVVQIGSHHWLRVPVGKLHTDRYIPLHPAVKTLLDDWIAQRPDTLRTNLLFVDRGRRMPRSRVQNAVADCAHRAGLAHVTPHQLCHTLANQAINRGMSLEAIAALLGHQSLTMTMVYARIADRTVADEYFNVTNRSKPSTSAPTNYPVKPRARTCAGSGPKPNVGCSETVGAPVRARSTAATRASARPAASSPPPSSSDPRCRPSTTTPSTGTSPTGSSSIKTCSRGSTTRPLDTITCICRRFFQDLLLHAQLHVLATQSHQLGTLGLVDLLVRLFPAPATVSQHPVAQRALVRPELTSDLRDRLTGLADHLDRGLTDSSGYFDGRPIRDPSLHALAQYQGVHQSGVAPYRLIDGEMMDDAKVFNDKLGESEDYYNFDRPHGGLGGQTPYERLRQKTSARTETPSVTSTPSATVPALHPSLREH